MNLQETIHTITAQFGERVLDDPLRLLGLLEDYHAFELESPQSRSAMRKMVREGQVRKLLDSNMESSMPGSRVDDVNWGEVLRQGKVAGKIQPQSPAAASPQNPYASLKVLPSIVKVPKVDKWRKLKSQWSRVKKWIGKNRGDIWSSVLIGLILLLGLLAVVSLFAVFCGLIQGWTNTESWAWTFFWSVVVGLIALGIGEMTIE